jgi:hypothetical protein
MHEITRVTLENEMDLILAYKRSMKLAELAGLSLPAQTSFATAVSEVARTTIEGTKKGCLILHVDADQREKNIIARINDEEIYDTPAEGWKYARRLVNRMDVAAKGSETTIDLFCRVATSPKIDIQKLDEWRYLFRNEPAISPYEELKRKNEQLLELSENVQKSEARYKTLTDALPLAIFSLSKDGQLLYANEWLTRYTGETIQSLNRNGWKAVVHPDDSKRFSLLMQHNAATDSTTITAQVRLRHKAETRWYWHQISLTPFLDDKKALQNWIGAIVDIHAQKVVEETLKDNVELKEAQKKLEDNRHELEQYIAELNRSNQELQQFAYIASHDLQEPIRKILFYSDYLLTQYQTTLDKKGADYLQSMRSASQRMRNLIHDILTFSQIKREELKFSPVDLNKIAKDVLQDLEMVMEEKGAVVKIDPLPTVIGDERMMRQLLGNIISNSLKYSRPNVPPHVRVTCRETENFINLTFSDNGIGFDNQYLPQIFGLFQRLHTRENYEGTGLGLAICRKIADIHGGSIEADGKEGGGARFSVSLPVSPLLK